MSDMRLSCRDSTNKAPKTSHVLETQGPCWLRPDKTDAYRTFFSWASQKHPHREFDSALHLSR